MLYNYYEFFSYNVFYKQLHTTAKEQNIKLKLKNIFDSNAEKRGTN